MSARGTAAAVVAAVSLAAGLAVAAGAEAGAHGAARAAAAPSVQEMIVGPGGALLAAARTVSAGPARVRVTGRSCRVAAGTPLAALAALRRAGGPRFSLRDYGHCGASPASSAQLFVYSLGGARNSGQNGWEYKVDGYAGSTGAADPAGVRGDGRRVRSGQHVLWFWCVAHGGGCQRTLVLQATGTTVSPGAAVTVTVTGQDNEARGIPVSGALVTLGSQSAASGADGRATLLAPSQPGRYELTASGAGLVPAFPLTIVVG